jgi:hypothetical protein
MVDELVELECKTSHAMRMPEILGENTIRWIIYTVIVVSFFDYR